MSTSISKQIDSIISERKKRLPLIERQLDHVREAQNAARQIMAVKRSLLNENGELNPNSPYYALFSESPDMTAGLSALSAADFLDESQKLIDKYEELKVRFSREYINIAVVGTARQGKSQFLKTVSGLDDRCIPAFSDGHCTGTSSIIQSSDSERVEAHITFKTEAEIIQEAQSYLDEITDKKLFVRSIEDIRNLYTRMSEIDRLWSESPDYKIKRSSKGLLFHTFKQRFCDEDHVKEWIGYIGSQPIVLTDEDEIMKYVAQYDGREKDSPTYFWKFIAVKKALIKRAFVYKDTGKIRMIDTEGLGASTTDTEKKMIETIRNESDAVISFDRPEGINGKYVGEFLGHGFDVINSCLADRKQEKWVSLIINHTPEIPEKDIHENFQLCKKHYDEITKHNLFSAAIIKIVNVSVREEVIDGFLVPFLTELTDNLSDIDSIYLSEALPLSDRAFAAYEALCKNLNYISKTRFNTANSIYYANNLITKTYDNLIAGVRNNNLRLGKNRNEVCYILSDRIGRIIDDMMNLIPNEAEIKTVCRKTGNSADEVFKDYLDKIRNKLTQQFIDVDTSLAQLTAEFKNGIATFFISDEYGKLGKVMDIQEGVDDYLNLYHFAQRNISESDYPQLSKAIAFLCEFEFSVRGFLMNKLRSNLYSISRARPDLTSGLRFDPQKGAEIGEEFGHAIYFNLMYRIHAIQDDLRNEFKDFFKTPNEALFAVSDEFFDRIYYSDGVRDEWRKLYSEYTMQLWGAELADNEKNKQVVKLWMDTIDNIQNYYKRENFFLRTE